MMTLTCNAEQFSKQLMEAFAAQEARLSFEYAAWTLFVFEDLVNSTPQWSGDTANNWRYSVGAPDLTYSPYYLKDGSYGSYGFEPTERGDPEATWQPIAKAQDGRMPNWNEKVYFSNNTPIAPEVEDHSIYIRTENLIGGAVAMASYMAAKYRNLTV